MNTELSHRQNIRSFNDLTEKEKNEIADVIRSGHKAYRLIIDEFRLKNLWVLSTIKKQYVTENSTKVKEKQKRGKMAASTKKKIQRSALAVAQVRQHDIVVGRELSLLDGILFNMEHLIKIINFHDDEINNTIEKVKEIYELMKANFEPCSEAESKRKVVTLGAVDDMLDKLNTFIYSHNIQIKAIAEIRQQGDYFVKHRDEIIGRAGLIQMIDDIYYAIAQLEADGYNKFREIIEIRSPLAFGLLKKMEANVLNNPDEM